MSKTESDNPVVCLERYDYISEPASAPSETAAASRVALAKYIVAINHECFDADERSNIYADQKYLAICLLIAGFFCNVSPFRATLERVFSQGGL